MQRRFLRKRGAAGVLAPPGGAVAQRLRGFKWRSEKSVKALAPTGAALAFLCFDFFFRIVKGEQPLETGCGTQHPLRALGGTRVLLAAAPTTPPCFRRWRRSSSLLLRGGWSPEVGRGESEHPSLPLAQRSVPARLRQAKTSPAERDAFKNPPAPGFPLFWVKMPKKAGNISLSLREWGLFCIESRLQGVCGICYT